MNQRGTTIIEATVALCVLGAAYGGAAQMLSVSGRQRHEADRYLAAVIEVNNIAEQIAATPYSELSQPALDALELSSDAQSTLPGAKLSVVVADVGAPEPPHKRFNLALTWSSIGGQPRSARLTTWRFASVEEEP